MTPTRPPRRPHLALNVAAVRTVTVSGPQAFSANGAVAQLSAVATMTDGSRQDWTTSATWASDQEGVARVSNVGLVTAVSGGVATISATVSGVRGILPVTVSTGVAPAPVPGGGSRTPIHPPASGSRYPTTCRPSSGS